MAGNNIRDKAKKLWIKGMKTIENTATNIANNTKYKVDEMTLQNRRRELAGDLSSVVYSLWLKGAELPEELTRILQEIQDLDDRLNDMRAEKYAQGKSAAEIRTITADGTADAAEQTDEAAEKDADEAPQAVTWPEIPAIHPDGTADQPEEAKEEEEAEEEEPLSEAITGAARSLQSEINGYFDHGVSVDKMAEKVNNSLDQLTDKIRSFAPEKADQPEENTSEAEK